MDPKRSWAEYWEWADKLDDDEAGKLDNLKDKYREINIESGFDFIFDEIYGTDKIEKPEKLKGKPIFFTSMLSGAGALDNGSKKRLIWHIKYVLERL